MKKWLYGIWIAGILISLCGCRWKTAGSPAALNASKGNEIVTGSADEAYSDEEIQTLKGEIKHIEKTVYQLVSKITHQAQLYRRLGDRFFELGLLKEAYHSYEQSLAVKDEASVHYKAAVVCANYAKQNQPLTDLQLNYEGAEFHYLKALQLRSPYQEATVGIGILYHFELNRHVEAWKAVQEGLQQANRPTPQLLMLHANICSFFDEYRQKNGAFPGAPLENWARLAYNDYNQVIELYGKLKNPEVQSLVASAAALKARFEK